MEKGRGKGTDTLQTDNFFTRKEYIERDAVKSAIYEIMDKYDPYDRCDKKAVIALQRADDAIDLIPAADVARVRHGRWVWNPNGMDWGIGAWCCSECKSKAETWWANDPIYNPLHCSGGHFCGNCGARMDGDGE